jgi:uncharacterized membrane protein YeaQ/YmgE (transglycosylase-associated protein family)
MNIIYWIVFGLITGSIANYITPNTQGGLLATIFLGIVGAVIGGFLGDKFFGVGVTGFNFVSFVVAVLGSVLVIYISRALLRN